MTRKTCLLAKRLVIIKGKVGKNQMVGCGLSDSGL